MSFSAPNVRFEAIARAVPAHGELPATPLTSPKDVLFLVKGIEVWHQAEVRPSAAG